MKTLSTPKFSRLFAYLFAFVFFLTGLAAGLGHGQLELTKQFDGNQAQAALVKQAADHEFELAYWKGAYAICISVDMNVFYADPVTSQDDCNRLTVKGIGLDVQHDPQYNDGFLDPFVYQPGS